MGLFPLSGCKLCNLTLNIWHNFWIDLQFEFLMGWWCQWGLRSWKRIFKWRWCSRPRLPKGLVLCGTMCKCLRTPNLYTNETKLVGIPHAPPSTTITIPTYVSTPYYYITCFQNHLSINMISMRNDNDTFSWYISIRSFHLFQSLLSWMSFFCLDVN